MSHNAFSSQPSRRAVLRALGLGGLCLGWQRGARAQGLSYFRIAAGLPGTPTYDLTGLIGGVISNPPGARSCEEGGSCGIPGLIALAQTSTGSLDSLLQLRAGAVEAAVLQADAAYLAYHGLAQYQGKGYDPALRAIAGLGRFVAKIAVPAAAPIRTIDQLVGRRIALGLRGSDNSVAARLLLGACGLPVQRFQPYFVDLPAATEAFIAGDLDALVVIEPPESQEIAELARRSLTRLLPIDGEERRALLARYPFLVPARVTTGGESIETVGMSAVWSVQAAMEEAFIYDLTRAIWSETARRRQNRTSIGGQAVDLGLSVAALGIPLHPGAARYYRESGGDAAVPPSPT